MLTWVRDQGCQTLDGYEVERAENGVAGLALFEQDPSRFDLVLLDMIMPEMNGSHCFAAIRKMRPDMKVVISSGFTRDEELRSLKAKGLHGFIRKPFRSAGLSWVVHEVIAGTTDFCDG